MPELRLCPVYDESATEETMHKGLCTAVPSAQALRLLSKDQRAKLLLGIIANLAEGYKPRRVRCKRILERYFASEPEHYTAGWQL